MKEIVVESLVSVDAPACRDGAARSRGWGEPEEIAAVVTFLVSERAVFITGTTIQIDGGSYPGLL